MKLDFRDFFYLDSDYVDNLLGHITGFIEEEYSEVQKEEKTNKGTGGTNIGIVKGDFEKGSVASKEISRRGTVNSEIRYKKLFDELKKRGLKQVDLFDDGLWDMLIEEIDFIEISGSIHFTKIYDLELTANFIGNLGSDLGIIDKKEAEDVIDKMSIIKEVQEKNGIPLKIQTLDSKYKVIAYLNNKFLVKNKSDITGNNYKILCKIEKKIPAGEKYDIFSIDQLERPFTNRDERRRNKNKSLPKEFKESVTGPVAIILPIAIYR